jgi:hypothetical protein
MIILELCTVEELAAYLVHNEDNNEPLGLSQIIYIIPLATMVNLTIPPTPSIQP